MIISLLGASVLALACGPRSRSEPGAVASLHPLQDTNKPEVRPKRRVEPKPDRKVDSRLNIDIAATEVRFALDVANVGRKHVELSFPNGKSHDFVVVDSLGREVWHWSAGRMFTQGVQNKQLGAGDTMYVSEAWKRPRPGHYTAIATLNSSNYPQLQRAEFTLP